MLKYRIWEYIRSVIHGLCALDVEYSIINPYAMKKFHSVEQKQLWIVALPFKSVL